MAKALLTISKQDTVPLANDKKVLELAQEQIAKKVKKNKRIDRMEVYEVWHPNTEFEDKAEDGTVTIGTTKGYGVKGQVFYKSGKDFPFRMPITIK